MADQVMVQVRFTQDGLSDALSYPVEQWPVPQEQIDADKIARVAAWKAVVANPVKPPEPTKEQLAEDIATLKGTLATFETKLAEVIAKEAAPKAGK
jgi:hypothetical protein